MILQQPRTLVIYHGNCPDGFGAALAAHRAHPDAEFVEGIYGKDPPAVAGRDVVIVDFSYPRATLERMYGEAASLRVIDHHKTAQADLAGLPYAEFDMERSGATLTWRCLVNDDVPELLRYVEDRDLWKFQLPDSHAVSLALWAQPRTFDAWGKFLHDVKPLAADGKAMQVYQGMLIRQMMRNAKMKRIAGYEVPIVNATVCFSEVGDALCAEFPAAPFAAYYFDRNDGIRQWGARSRNGFDVSAVAKMFGGGGHAAAAGWTEKLEA